MRTATISVNIISVRLSSMIKRLLWRIVHAYRARQHRRAVAENRSLIARVRAEADAMEELKRMREKGRE